MLHASAEKNQVSSRNYLLANVYREPNERGRGNARQGKEREEADESIPKRIAQLGSGKASGLLG